MGILIHVNENNFVGGIIMKKTLLFVSTAALSMSLLVGCNTDGNGNNLNPTGVNYNNDRLNTENVRYNNGNGMYRGDDMLDPGNVRYDMDNRYHNNRGNNGDADLLDVDYDNAEPDPGAEPNERNRGLFNGNNNGNLNGNGAMNGAGGGMGTGVGTR